MSGVVLITQSEELVGTCERALAGMRVRTHRIGLESRSELQARLRKIVDNATGIVDGSINVQAAIVDGELACAGGRGFVVTEPLYEELPAGANSLLDMLLGAGIPVLVDAGSLPANAAYLVGRHGGRLLRRDRAGVQVRKAIEDVPYNRETLRVENEFARNYDAEELSGAATVSAILSENEFVVSELREFAKERTEGLRILDLGCGTGRFEEILLTDPKLCPSIKEIVAVDFAPRYLVKARKRLAHFLPAEDLDKITFLRRVAEDLHLPDGHFDVVLASFGVVCFSRSHLTLQEVARVTKNGGLTVFNGYNRSALTYEFDAKVAHTGDPVTHFAIHIDKGKNLMRLGSQVIDCMTFDVDAFESLLRLVGLRPRSERSRTFPTFYGAARRTYLTELVPSATAESNAGIHAGCRRPGVKCGEHLSYQDQNLATHTDSGFNDLIHKMDVDLERVLNRKGFYFSVAAFKGAEAT
jgi:ubiquinone/menaquinone biosynthesis C-methylase UbiE